MYNYVRLSWRICGFAVRVNRMQYKDIFGDIEADTGDGVHDALLTLSGCVLSLSV
jgi:hypothetical protein